MTIERQLEVATKALQEILKCDGDSYEDDYVVMKSIAEEALEKMGGEWNVK